MHSLVSKSIPTSLVHRMESQVGIITVIWCIINAFGVSGLKSVRNSNQSASLPPSPVNSFESPNIIYYDHRRLESIRILNGTDVGPGQYLYVGLLFIGKADLCSAVLISPDVALCGCHCLIEENWYDWKYPQVLMEPEKIALLIECPDLSIPRGQMRTAKELGVHRKCSKNGTKVTYNYGLIKFEEPFLRVLGYAETIELPNFQTPSLIDQMIQNEEPCVLVGWTPQTDEGVSSRMQEFKAKLRHHDWCSVTIHNLTADNEEGPDYYLPDHHICASSLHEGTSGCFGDNLGPLLCGVEKKILIGIFSFEPTVSCLESMLPTVGSRLDLVSDWINSFLEEKRPAVTGKGLLKITRPSNFHVTSLSALLFLIMYNIT